MSNSNLLAIVDDPYSAIHPKNSAASALTATAPFRTFRASTKLSTELFAKALQAPIVFCKVAMVSGTASAGRSLDKTWVQSAEI